jgi:hypothetical protein
MFWATCGLSAVALTSAGELLASIPSTQVINFFLFYFRKSHQTTPLLPPPTPPSFPLDFSRLLQATKANPTSRTRSRRKSGLHSRPSRVRLMEDKIPEEEEGWDLVDDAADGRLV